ncbi:MAG TPA: SDR family oxidoreductase [Candidatus Limnocylindrales bacterium]|nr:SDR family oxidoreductase [Candidatus Limnocylindrales bacterium]
MDLGLTDHRVLVCGASRGLGAAVARLVATEGARVAVAARPSEDLAAVAAETGGTMIAADLAASDGPASAVRDAVAALGGLDGLLVNSGGPPPGTFAEIGEDDWERAIAMTLQSTLRVIRESLPHLRDGRDPSIAIILSSSVREPIAGLVTSNVLRPGLAGLIKSLVPEIAPIRINGLAPGRFGTERIRTLDTRRAADAGTTVEEIERQTIARIPLGRYGDPEELGRVAAFLLSPAASYLTGVIVPVDGGMVRSLP